MCFIGNSGLNMLQCLNLALSSTSYFINQLPTPYVSGYIKTNQRKAFRKFNGLLSKNNKIQSKYMWIWAAYCFGVIHNP